MKAVVWEGVGDIRLEDVPEPKIKQSTDAIVRLTASAICGTDLHFIRGTMTQFANVGLVKLPEEVTDEQAILLSDIFPTGYFGAELAEIKAGDILAIFGCGPVGQFALASAKLMHAGRLFAIDNIPDRLEMAKAQGAEIINFDEANPVEEIRRLTDRIGVDRAIDAVGVDSTTAHAGPPADVAEGMKEEFRRELKKIAPEQHAGGDNWHPGEAPFGWLEERSPGKGINWNYSVDGRLALHSGAIGPVEWDELV